MIEGTLKTLYERTLGDPLFEFSLTVSCAIAILFLYNKFDLKIRQQSEKFKKTGKELDDADGLAARNISLMQYLSDGKLLDLSAKKSVNMARETKWASNPFSSHRNKRRLINIKSREPAKRASQRTRRAKALLVFKRRGRKGRKK